MANLPIIDISPFLPSANSSIEKKLATATALSRACIDVGFFYLTGHGVCPQLQSSVLETSRRFFICASPSQKASIARREVGPGGGDGARGYQALLTNKTNGESDWHEAIDFYRVVPREDPSNFIEPGNPETGLRLCRGVNMYPSVDCPGSDMRAVLSEYFINMLELGEIMMRAMAWAAGYEDDEEIFLRNTRESFWSARVIGYPPLSRIVDKTSEDTVVSVGEHTDYGCVTFLLVDETPDALQVRSRDGRWINAEPIEGAYLVNIGDMMERWTNGVWKSTPHRVLNRGKNFRISMPFFYEPDFYTVIRPLQKFVDAVGGEVRYEERIYGTHLLNKVANNFNKVE